MNKLHPVVSMGEGVGCGVVSWGEGWEAINHVLGVMGRDVLLSWEMWREM